MKYDLDFLTKLDKAHMKVQYARMELLSFDEKPLSEIQGKITSGSISVDGSSAVRRTMSLSMIASPNNSNLTDLDNEISINKKVRIFIGYENPFKDYINKYGDMIWFPCGLYILSSASVNRSTSGWSISINGKDKMCMLDGTVGGILPASTTFHEKLIELENGDYETQYPTISEIIKEAVYHWGGELAENIIISDIDETVKLLVRYMGDSPIYFNDDYSSFSFSPSDDYDNPCVYNQDAGYKQTSFTYPNELILNAGETVVSLLDKIKTTLGNYEYFYDLDGRFIFQEIKNYLSTTSPLNELVPEYYVKTYDNSKYLYSLTDLDTTSAITVSPKYDNIKNDYYVWGQRTTDAGAEIDICYHLAIDHKPEMNKAGQYMWEIRKQSGKTLVEQLEDKYNQLSSDINDEEYADLMVEINNLKSLIEIKGEDYQPTTLERYEYTKRDEEPTLFDGEAATLVGIPLGTGTFSYDWREELYREALEAQTITGVYNNYYDSELIKNWRNLFDPQNTTWEATNGWNPDIKNNPAVINYWLDFIDTDAAIGKYSISQIGRRTKVENDTNIKMVYKNEVPDVIFLQPGEKFIIKNASSSGQHYFQLQEKYYDMFETSSTGSSCYDKIRDLLYQNLSYNTTITITCLPKYYLEPNNIIRIVDKESNICGNYQVTQFTLPLTYNGTMSITATEVLTRV